MLNISTRARAETGNKVLIAGFILGGSGGKNILVRALGPSLGARGVNAPLLNPSLQLFDSSGGLLASNDDWMSNTNAQQISDSGLAPTDSRESAILTNLGPGSYTAVVTGVDDPSNDIALVEVYDLDSLNTPLLLNISTRGTVDTDEGQMIAGFIIGGATDEAIVIRGLGPSLAGGTAPIANPLPNPELVVYDGLGQAIATNDSWQDDPQAAAIMNLGLAPSNALEAATLISLPPGSYTAVLSDANGNSGVGLIELYNVTNQ